MKKFPFFLILAIFFGCTSNSHNCKSPDRLYQLPDSLHQLDLGQFKIIVPVDWKYEDPGKQEDSFVGQILGPDLQLNFDCSERGYANHLIETEKEYLDNRDWWAHDLAFPFWGTKSDVHTPDASQKKHFPKADYIADLTFNDKTFYFTIEIPATIKGQHIQIDSNHKYVFRTIWPKIVGKGITGIYIHSKSSTFNFQMHGQNLSAKNQDLALLAFKTITFK